MPDFLGFNVPAPDPLRALASRLVAAAGLSAEDVQDTIAEARATFRRMATMEAALQEVAGHVLGARTELVEVRKRINALDLCREHGEAVEALRGDLAEHLSIGLPVGTRPALQVVPVPEPGPLGPVPDTAPAAARAPVAKKARAKRGR